MLSDWLSRSAAAHTSRKSRVSPRNADPVLTRLRRWLFRGALAVAVILLTALGIFSYLRAIEFLYRSPYFEIRSVSLHGLDFDLRNAVVRDARLEEIKGRNLLLLNPDWLEKRILAHPLVADASVIKRHPDAVRILARARKPLAYLSAEGGMWQVDEAGVLMEEAGTENEEDLPFITGIKIAGMRPGDKVERPGLERTLDLIQRMKSVNPKLHQLTSEIHIGEDGDLTVILRGGVEARFGKGDPLERIVALERFLDTHDGLAGLQYVDLRFEKQLVYR